jgi:hypothetical protein
MYLPYAQDGVQSLTFKTPLPKATERQLVHVRPVTSSLEGMQLGSYPAGRTWPWPLQLTSTTWLDSADAGPAARTTPAVVPAMATRAPANATRTRTRMNLIELPAFQRWVPITLSELDARHLIQRGTAAAAGRDRDAQSAALPAFPAGSGSGWDRRGDRRAAFCAVAPWRPAPRTCAAMQPSHSVVTSMAGAITFRILAGRTPPSPSAAEDIWI